MRIVFPRKIERAILYLKLKFVPQRLFFRTMLMIFVPLIAVQVVSIWAFFDGNWGKMGRNMSNSVVQDIAFVTTLAENKTIKIADLQKLTKEEFGMKLSYYAQNNKYQAVNKITRGREMITGFLEDALKEKFGKDKVGVYVQTDNRKDLEVFVENKTGVFQFSMDRKKIFSSSAFGFMIWMVVTSFLLFLVSVLFLRIQVRSISRLAQVAEDFGKGIDDKTFHPTGSSEVRKASLAFIQMKERIQKQISERTQMLAGVSHDLRTPLTRMKLQMAMWPDNPEKAEFLQDIDEMQKMLEGYLSFVSGEAGEMTSFVDLNEMLLSILNKFRNKKALIKYSTNDQVSAIQGREQALKRALTNVIGNAFYYGKTIAVKLESYNNKLQICVEDDGPGIPKDKREEVFKAFYRIEGSRNKETGGVGLGLSIAKDVITSHGGKIELSESGELKGLKVLIIIPL